MRIAIIHAPYSRQASTVKDSIESFSLYGNNQFIQVQLRNGELETDLSNFDALILHYSCIAFPYEHYRPISARSALKITNFKGLKLALVQDEQRSGIDRVRFLNTLGVNHLFSVAESNLYEVLYPSKERSFSISTVLTGYVSDQHVQVAKKRIPLLDRKIDICYRGRRLPSWMGKTALLKGEVPEIVRNIPDMNTYVTDLSSDEENRIYADQWYEFLQNSRVSIGTPSGSDYLDLHGKFLEPWVTRNSSERGNVPDPTPAKYQVVSPRYFDYVAAGNLVVLTPGLYSGIPIEGTFISLPDDLEGLTEIIEFSKTDHAQRMVDKSQEKIVSNPKLHYRFYVEQIESTIELLVPKDTLQNQNIETKSESRELANTKPPKFTPVFKSWIFYLASRNLVFNQLLNKVHRLDKRIYHVIKILLKFRMKYFIEFMRNAPVARPWHYLSVRLFWEVAQMYQFAGLLSRFHYKLEVNERLLLIEVVKFSSIEKEENAENNRANWQIKKWMVSFKDFGALQYPIVLRTLPTIFMLNPALFWTWARALEVTSESRGILDK